MTAGEKVALQSALAKPDPPVLLASECTKKAEMLERVARPIINRPAPTPAKPAAEPTPEVGAVAGALCGLPCIAVTKHLWHASRQGAVFST